MTIEGKLERLCFENGLWPNEAEAIVKAYQAEDIWDMAERWNDDIEGYTPELIAALWMGVKRCALAWIDANKPQHWARPMFDGTAENLVK